MKRVRYAAAVALLALLSGCGGPQGGSSAGSRAGRLTLKVVWPAPSKLIPAASNSIKAVLTSGSTTLGSQTLPRPTTGSTASVTFSDLQPGAVTLTATAFPNADGTGVAQATGSAPATIVAGQTAQVTITLNSTIATLTITPANPTVIVGQTTPLTATARDASGNVVLVAPGSLQWSSAATGTATVDANGVVTGVAAGTSAVTVKDSESGITSPPVTVTVALNPLSDPRFMTITPDGQFLYVVSEGTKTVTQFHINANGSLTPLAPANTGPLPANPLVFKIQANPQSSLPFVYVLSPDLDLISQFRYDTTGALSPLTPPTASVSAGDHPAEVAIHPNGQFLYTADPVNQAQGTIPRISQFRINADGTLTSLGPDVLISPGFNVNRLVVTRDGKFLYTINGLGQSRGQALKAFQINADGTLTLIGEFGGTSFNTFELAADPTSRFLYTANNTSAGGTVAAFKINADGSLTQLGSTPPAGISAPTSIQVTPNGKFVYVVDPTDNLLFAYGVQADGSLAPLSPASVATGQTPLEVRITPNGQFLYVCNSRDNSISAFRINADGSLASL